MPKVQPNSDGRMIDNLFRRNNFKQFFTGYGTPWEQEISALEINIEKTNET